MIGPGIANGYRETSTITGTRKAQETDAPNVHSANELQNLQSRSIGHVSAIVARVKAGIHSALMSTERTRQRLRSHLVSSRDSPITLCLNNQRALPVIALTRDFHVLTASAAARLAAVLFSLCNVAFTGKVRAFPRRLHLGHGLCHGTSFKWYMGSEPCGTAGTQLHNDDLSRFRVRHVVTRYFRLEFG